MYELYGLHGSSYGGWLWDQNRNISSVLNLVSVFAGLSRNRALLSLWVKLACLFECVIPVRVALVLLGLRVIVLHFLSSFVT